MYIEFCCSHTITDELGNTRPCQKKLKAEQQYAGKQVRCPRCQQMNLIPAESSATAGSVPIVKGAIEVPVSEAPTEAIAVGHSPQTLPGFSAPATATEAGAQQLKIVQFDPFIRCPHCGATLDMRKHCTRCRYFLPIDASDEIPVKEMKVKLAGFLLYLRRKVSIDVNPIALGILIFGFAILICFAFQALAILIFGNFGLLLLPFLIAFLITTAMVYLKVYSLATVPMEQLAFWQIPLWDLVLTLIRNRYWGKATALDLREQPVTDKELFLMPELRTAAAIDLEGQPITDAGLLALRQLLQLRYLVLKNTKVTDEGVFRLQQMIPEAWIWH